ncbi:MAG: diheme cytochrome c [Candidatus Marinimicrobia bacterium]|nr:diheme cytochrome c [Candidatus Neomarinimicrobiota bacterium]
MNRKTLAVSILLSTAMLAVSGVAASDDEKGGFMNRWFGGSKPGVAPVENPQYLEECGGCHFPYQPGLLPARSWVKLMMGLENHFGENAELPLDDAKRIENYLVINAADHSSYKRSQKIMKYIRPGDVPLRISETAYFIKEHDELSRKMVQDNPQVGSFSKCESCHTQAAKGSFEENEINIPGFGRWEDD